MHPYQDPSQPITRRADDLLGRMTLDEKAGMLFHAPAIPGRDGALIAPGEFSGLPVDRMAEQIHGHIRHFNILGSASPRDIARWHNVVQDLAASSRLGIPVTLSSDPRHGFDANPATGATGMGFSRWPEPLGLAATRDVELVRRHARVVRRELAAVGIRVLLGPSADLASEPRWARLVSTFGADAELVGEMVAAFVEELQGPQLGPTSVAAMVKHFPGAGPQCGGEDAHFAYGREQVYPGGRFEEHLEPFVRAFAAGASQMMPYYAIPVALPDVEPVGFAFNSGIITGLARDRLGFDGIICTDWGLVTDVEIFGSPWPARAWGVEHLDRASRVERILEAGCDQLGGECAPELVVQLVTSGRLAESRLDVSVRRLLAEKFRLGLFDRRHVDVDAVGDLVGTPAAVAEGCAAQSRSVVVLTTGRNRTHDPLLPLPPGATVYVEGVNPSVAARYARVTADPDAADLAVVRIAAPYEPRTEGFERFFHAGSLEFAAEQVDRVLSLARRVPVVLDVFLDRAAVVAPFAVEDIALVASFGVTDAALLDVLFARGTSGDSRSAAGGGRSAAGGRLPIELPPSMADVRRQREDVALDAQNPTFPYGAGLPLQPVGAPS